MDITLYREFAKNKLGLEFNDINLLVTALTHRSYVNEHKKVHEHNERLEFLGDAVLELVSSDFLYRNYDYLEGVMIPTSGYDNDIDEKRVQGWLVYEDKEIEEIMAE